MSICFGILVALEVLFAYNTHYSIFKFYASFKGLRFILKFLSGITVSNNIIRYC